MTTVEGGGTGFTVTVPEPATLFGVVAVIATGPPAFTPVTTPFPSTVAMDSSLLFQVNVVDTGFCDPSTALAENDVVNPAMTLAELGVTVTVAGWPPATHVMVGVALLRGAAVARVKSSDALPVYAQPF